MTNLEPGSTPDRDAALAATLARLEPVAREIGVTRLANITGLDAIGLPVWTTIRPTSRALATSQGKGLCHQQAKVSALMESIEVWHAESHCAGLVFESPQRVTATIGLRFVPPQRLAVLKNVRISDAEPILWSRGQDLMTGSPVLIPWEAVTLNSLPSAMRRTLLLSSNGLAGGVSKWDAILHALCEIVERHEIGNWFGWDLAQRRARRVDLAKLDGKLGEVVEMVRPHCAIGLWDITGGLGIPTYACMLVDHADSDTALQVGSCSGFATHASAASAALRAILEAVQARATTIAGSRDDLDDDVFEAARHAGRAEAARLEIADTARGLPLRADAGMAGLPPRQAVAHVLDVFMANGIADAYAVDLSHERFGIPVFKCIVPQLSYKGVTTIMREEINMKSGGNGHWRGVAAADTLAGAGKQAGRAP